MSKIKDFWSQYQERLILTISGILIASASFAAGRLMWLEKSEPVVIEDPTELTCQCPESSMEQTDAGSESKNIEQTIAEQLPADSYVASKNGSKYYLTTCSGANRIKEDNKVFFDSIEEAETEGYEPAKNCKGL